ncbi:type II/IV secretion system protein [Paeniglutamicibacter antarcticus]|uniref:Type II/IV secretion system protein n=1 Tax=Arthrobacter terrae TaxID=2935737 RepID=A0A931G3N6_9MICC|nr:GspE/PulE family protein [Arthrobacter terrae]MBG0738866.1 type II/IV secretion system protein [Arthrobacter terrae]
MSTSTTSRLETHFVQQDILTAREFETAEQQAATQGLNVLAFLKKQGRISHEQTCEAFAFLKGWTYKPLRDDTVIPADVIALIEFQLARKLNIVPVALDGDDLTVACVNPFDVNVTKQLQSKTGKNITAVYSSTNELTRAVGRFYSASIQAQQVGKLAAMDVSSEAARTKRPSLVVVGDEGNIVNTLDAIIEGALEVGASDIHFEPASTHLTVRYSVDGKLRNEPDQPKELAPRLAGLIKTRARLSSSELVNQDGAITHEFRGKSYDLRVAVLPAAWGESITLRMGASEAWKLGQIGFSEDTEAQWRRSINQPNGICLAVGPMGSGKTSLHYASLDALMGQGRKIVSLENPVEMKLPNGMTQVSINEPQGLTWDGGMETVLRSAASVLFVGEINKDAIAHTAVTAAITGHLVLSTLHTNDAPGAVLRLREMGLRPSVLADSMRAVCAQRLPRRLCKCKTPTPPGQDMIRDFKLTDEDLRAVDPVTGLSLWYGPKGCPECNGTGYKGRLPIHELMTFPRHIRDLITDDVPNRVLADAAKANGMLTLQDDGLLKVRAGLTSLEEVRSHILID